jgi:hypothetical protein
MMAEFVPHARKVRFHTENAEIAQRATENILTCFARSAVVLLGGSLCGLGALCVEPYIATTR